MVASHEEDPVTFTFDSGKRCNQKVGYTLVYGIERFFEVSQVDEILRGGTPLQDITDLLYRDKATVQVSESALPIP
jgi:hypothetical protein